MKKQRHKWGEKSSNMYTSEQQQCVVCGIWKYKALGTTMYSADKITENEPLTAQMTNQYGCDVEIIKEYKEWARNNFKIQKEEFEALRKEQEDFSARHEKNY